MINSNHKHGWGYRRKTLLCRDIAAGRISIADACVLYNLGQEELTQYYRNYTTKGIEGLLMPRGVTREGKPGRQSRKMVKQQAIAKVLEGLLIK